MEKIEQKPLGIMKSTFHQFSEDDCSSMAGALAYFTMFALPPLLVIIIAILGFVFGEQAAQGQVVNQIQGYVGAQGAQAIQAMIAQAGKSHTGSIVATVISIAAILFGAIGAFMQLQKALNKTWAVEPDPKQGGVKQFVTKRLLSFGIILLMALLLVVLLAAGAVVSALGSTVQNWVPVALSGSMLQALNFLVTLLIMVILFAVIFKYLPDARVGWVDVWVGAAFTALLFTIGKLLISIYLGRSNPGTAYGAAGSLVVLLLWIYYASLIVLFGAEFTQAWARGHGSEIRPAKGAMRIIKQKETVRE